MYVVFILYNSLLHLNVNIDNGLDKKTIMYIENNGDIITQLIKSTCCSPKLFRKTLFTATHTRA